MDALGWIGIAILVGVSITIVRAVKSTPQPGRRGSSRSGGDASKGAWTGVFVSDSGSNGGWSSDSGSGGGDCGGSSGGGSDCGAG